MTLLVTRLALQILFKVHYSDKIYRVCEVEEEKALYSLFLRSMSRGNMTTEVALTKLLTTCLLCCCCHNHNNNLHPDRSLKRHFPVGIFLCLTFKLNTSSNSPSELKCYFLIRPQRRENLFSILRENLANIILTSKTSFLYSHLFHLHTK